MFRQLAIATLALFATSAVATTEKRELGSKYAKAKTVTLCGISGVVTGDPRSFFGGTDTLYSCDDVNQEYPLADDPYTCFYDPVSSLYQCTEWFLFDDGTINFTYVTDDNDNFLGETILGTSGWFPKTPKTIASIEYDYNDPPEGFDFVYTIEYTKKSYDPTA